MQEQRDSLVVEGAYRHVGGALGIVTLGIGAWIAIETWSGWGAVALITIGALLVLTWMVGRFPRSISLGGNSLEMGEAGERQSIDEANAQSDVADLIASGVEDAPSVAKLVPKGEGITVLPTPSVSPAFRMRIVAEVLEEARDYEQTILQGSFSPWRVHTGTKNEGYDAALIDPPTGTARLLIDFAYFGSQRVVPMSIIAAAKRLNATAKRLQEEGKPRPACVIVSNAPVPWATYEAALELNVVVFVHAASEDAKKLRSDLVSLAPAGPTYLENLDE